MLVIIHGGFANFLGKLFRQTFYTVANQVAVLATLIMANPLHIVHCSLFHSTQIFNVQKKGVAAQCKNWQHIPLLLAAVLVFVLPLLPYTSFRPY